MPEFPDFDDPDAGGGEDPFGGAHGLDLAIGDAGDLAVESIGKANIPTGVSADVMESLPKDLTTSIDINVRSIPTTADGNLGKMVQANVLDDLKDPAISKGIIDDALGDALKAKGNAASITPDDVRAATDTEMKAKITQTTTNFKTSLKDTVAKATAGTEVDVSPGSTGAKLLDSMVDDPAGTEVKLNGDAADIEAKDPNWKETVKSKLVDGGKALLSYGGKALLILAVCGAIIPGTNGPIDKLASMAGDALQKVLVVAANILQAFLGPFIAGLMGLLAKLKGPLIVIGIVILILIIGYIYKTFLKKA